MYYQMSYTYPFSATLPFGYSINFLKAANFQNLNGTTANVTIAGGVDDDVSFVGPDGPAYQPDQFPSPESPAFPDNPVGRRNGAHDFTYTTQIPSESTQSLWVANNGITSFTNGTVTSDLPLQELKSISVTTDSPQKYTGSGINFVTSVNTTPIGLPYTIKYNGSTDLPVNVNTYHVVVSLDDYPDVTASVDVHITKSDASVEISIDIPDRYYFNNKQVTPIVTTSPAGLSYQVKYNSSATPIHQIGNYVVTATITDPNYSTTASVSKNVVVYTDCTNGIYAYYTMDETSGSRKDITRVFNLTEFNGPIASGEGIINNAAVFSNPANHPYQGLIFNNFPTLKQFSICFWIKMSTDVASIIFTREAHIGWNYSFFYGSGLFAFLFENYEGSSDIYIDRLTNPTDWHFVCGVYDAYEDRKVRFYVDGQRAIKDISTAIVDSGRKTLSIGKSDTLEKAFSGSIDEVGIFQRALSDQEVMDIFQNKKRPAYGCQPPVPPPAPPSPPYVPPTNPPDDQPICPWFYMQPSPYIEGISRNAYRICAGTRQALYAAVAEFRVNKLLIPAGYVQTDVDSFLWAQNLNGTNIPISGWNYCQGNVRITGVDLEDLYRAVAAYRQDNGIDVGNWIYDVDTYLAGLVDAVGNQVRVRGCGCL